MLGDLYGVRAKGTEAGITLCSQYNAYAYDNPRGGLWNMADFTLCDGCRSRRTYPTNDSPNKHKRGGDQRAPHALMIQREKEKEDACAKEDRGHSSE